MSPPEVKIQDDTVSQTRPDLNLEKTSSVLGVPIGVTPSGKDLGLDKSYLRTYEDQKLDFVQSSNESPEAEILKMDWKPLKNYET